MELPADFLSLGRGSVILPLSLYIYEGIKKTHGFKKGFDLESQESIKSLYHQREVLSVTDLA